MASAASGSRLSYSRSTARSGTPSIASMTIADPCGVSTYSYRRTTWGSSRPRRIPASARNSVGNLSSGRVRSLTGASRPGPSCRASTTRPNPPRPSSRTVVYPGSDHSSTEQSCCIRYASRGPTLKPLSARPPGGPVGEYLGVAVEGLGLEQFEVEVVRAVEDAVGAGHSGDHGEDRNLDGADQAGVHRCACER